MGIAAYCVFMITVIGVTVLASAITRSMAVSALLSFCGLIILNISGSIPGVGNMLPGVLLSKTVELSHGIQPTGIIWPCITAILIAVLCIFMSIRLLERQEI